MTSEDQRFNISNDDNNIVYTIRHRSVPNTRIGQISDRVHTIDCSSPRRHVMTKLCDSAFKLDHRIKFFLMIVLLVMLFYQRGIMMIYIGTI